MGVVQRVFDLDGRRHLARKVMLGQVDGGPSDESPRVDDRSLGRFLEEAQVTCQLDQPGIVPVHEIGVDDAGRVYFTMKLVKGDDLRKVLERVGAGDDEWTEARALDTLLRACEAMAFAHERGVVHRDLKPSNIMVGRFGEVYVMDWGLARILGREDSKDIRIRPATSTSTAAVGSLRSHARDETPDSPLVTMDGDVVGTPAYMAPEQARGEVERVGPWVDVYGMGAILYQLLTGQMPYVPPDARLNNHAIWALVQQRPPEPVTSLRRDAPPRLVAICEKAMAREIDARYPNMDALARDLRAFLEHRVVEAYATGPLRELQKWVRRNRAVFLVATASILGIAAGLAWAVTERGRADRLASRAARLNQLTQLSDIRRVSKLLDDHERLWPALPDRVEAIRSWIAVANALLARQPTHERIL